MDIAAFFGEPDLTFELFERFCSGSFGFLAFKLFDFSTFKPFNLPTFKSLDFFDGDTDNLYCWGIHIARVAFRNGHEHIQSFHNQTKDTVLAV